MYRLLQQTSNAITTIVVLTTLATQFIPRARVNWLKAVDWAFMVSETNREGPDVQFDERETVKRGDKIAGFTVSDPFLPCKNPSQSTEDCRTWEGYARSHLGADVVTPEGKKLVMFGVRGQSFKVKCSGSADSNEGGGLVATIEAHGYTFQAMHLDKCQSGKIKVGRVFAETGNSGYSTGPHLHWTQKRKGTPIDPHKVYLEATLSGGIIRNEVSEIEHLKSAIVQQESGGNAQIKNPDSGAIGMGQVMPENVPSWTKQCLGKSLSPGEFQRNHTAQEEVLYCKLQQYWNASKSKTTEEKVRDVAAMWYAGNASYKNDTRLQPYGNNVYPSIETYTYDVLERFQDSVEAVKESETQGDSNTDTDTNTGTDATAGTDSEVNSGENSGANSGANSKPTLDSASDDNIAPNSPTNNLPTNSEQTKPQEQPGSGGSNPGVRNTNTPDRATN